MDREVILIADLLVAEDNPRHANISDNQLEAIHEMVMDQGGKLVKLGKDIVEFGLNPAEHVIVNKSLDAETQNLFVVAEGNRRITALKLLLNPNLIKDLEPATFQKFKALSHEFRQSPHFADEVECVVMSEEIAAHWVELKHTGANDGVGVVSWDGSSAERFRERRGKASLPLQFLRFGSEYADISQDMKTKLSNVSVTNLQRILGDKDVKEFLGISFQGEQLKSYYPASELSKPAKKIIEDLAERRINVNDIRNKSDRLKYLGSFLPEQIPDRTRRAEELYRDFSTRVLEGGSKDPAAEGDASVVGKRMRSKPSSIRRKYLIPHDCTFSIENPKINAIYGELRSLPVNDFRHAVAILLRVFIELSLDIFVEEKKLKGVSRKSSLSTKVDKVAERFISAQIMGVKETKEIANRLKSETEWYSVPNLNSIVHSTIIQPTADSLKIGWDNIEPFLTKLWSELQ